METPSGVSRLNEGYESPSGSIAGKSARANAAEQYRNNTGITLCCGSVVGFSLFSFSFFIHLFITIFERCRIVV